MNNLSNDSLDLFPMDGVLAEASRRAEAPEEKQSIKIAREFVRWCCSFGSDFRNSPDLINLRYWSHKGKLKLKEAEQEDVLVEARRLFLKKMDQLTRKADASLPQMNTMSE